MDEAAKTIPSDWDLPFAHLQLSARAYNACFSTECKTISDVIEALNTGQLSQAAVGRKTHSEIEAAIAEISKFIEADGSFDWPKVWELRGIAPHRIALTSRELQRIVHDARRRQIGILHLRKSCSGLEAVGISDVGALLDAAKSGIGKLENFGKTARGEVIGALKSLSGAVNQGGEVDWEKYAENRGFKLLPAQASKAANAEKFLQTVPEICAAVFQAQFDERAWQVFKRRLVVPETSRETLESLGKVYGITRERIRQVEEEGLSALRSSLLADDYRSLGFRFRKEIGTMFRDANEHFESLGLPAWTESRWMAELAVLWKADAAHIRRFDRLIVETLGYLWESPNQFALEPLILAATTPKSEIDTLLKSVVTIYETLSDHCQGTDAFELVRALKANGITTANPDDISTLVDLCSTAEVAGVDARVYRLKFQNLRGRADQTVRVLSEKAKPMHHTDLLREINQRLPVSKRIKTKENFINQLVPDKRLHPIGKSGNWALAEWGADGRALIDIIEDVLATAGEAMDQETITESVLQKRSGAAASIPMILSFNSDRFRRIAPGFYALAAWGDSVTDAVLDDDSVAEFVRDYFKTIGSQSVDFKELRSAFSKVSGLSSRSAAGVLGHHPAVSVTLTNSYNRTANYLPDWPSKLKKRKYHRQAPLQFDLIVDEAKKILTASPSGELPLIDVVKSVQTAMGIKRVNVYSALSVCEDVEKIAVEGSAFKVLRLRGTTRVNLPQIASMRTEDWQKECERAIAKLTIEEVDIGLFMLGRQFDQAMKQLLQGAKDAGLPILPGHMDRLQSRIDWAFSQGLFHDKPTLNVLRIERNERGHHPPTEDERRAAMKYAPFLAGLYLDYLIMIEKHIESFRSAKTGLKS